MTDLKQHPEFLEIIKELKDIPDFKLSKNYKHHGGDNNLYNHSIDTAYCVYRLCNFFGVTEEHTKSAVIAALLHDFYGYDCHNPENFANLDRLNSKGIQKFTKLHAFYHGKLAIENIENYIELSEQQKDAILKHMFPLYPIPPKYIEGWLITTADKIIATKECIHTPFFLIKQKMQPKKVA